MNEKNRVTFIDYTKFIACISVIAVHFSLNLQTKIPVEKFNFGLKLFFAIDYQLFVSCVPLFLLCTGFLMTNKKYSKSYLLSLIKIYSAYVLCSILTAVIASIGKQRAINIGYLVHNILTFKEIGYSWYVEMYMGLFLIIPILNRTIKNSSKKEVQQIILVLLLIVSVPKFINSASPLNEHLYLPSFWTTLYPIMYYFIGAYLKVFHIKLLKLKPGLLMYLSIFILGIIINVSNSDPYIVESSGGYASILIVIQSVILLLLLMNITNKLRENRIVTFFSKLTLPIYLMSFASDIMLYPYFTKLVGKPQNVLYLFPIVVCSSFVFSTFLAFFVDIINRGLFKLFFKRFDN